MDVVTLGAALNDAKKYTDSVVEGIANGIRYRGEVNYYADLPSDPEEGDAYTVKYAGSSGSVLDGSEYIWGSKGGTMQWIDFGKDSYTKAETDNLLNGKQDTIDSSHKLDADLVDDDTSTNKFVTAAEKTSIGTSATKLTGISATGSDHITLSNGRTLYVTATEPTGNIPDGDIWFDTSTT